MGCDVTPTLGALRPAPFLLAAAYIAIGLGLTVFWVKETRGHAHHESQTTSPPTATTTAH